MHSALDWPREGGVGVARRGRSLAGWEALTQPRPARWEGPWEARERCTLPAVHGVALAPLSQPARGTGAPQATGGLAPALLVLLMAQLI